MKSIFLFITIIIIFPPKHTKIFRKVYNNWMYYKFS